MPGIAENAIETAVMRTRLNEEQTILANIEITAACRWRERCSDRCILEVVNSRAGKPMEESKVMAAGAELVRSPQSRRVRHLGVVGREPLEAPGVLLGLLRLWHGTPAEVRPGTFGVITAAAGPLAEFAPSFADNPMTWLNVSIDTAAVGLRAAANAGPLLKSALKVRELGGTEAVGVNTLLTPDNLEEVVGIGRQVERAGVDQFSIGPFLVARAGRMEPLAGAPDFRRAVDRLAAEFAGTAMQVRFEVDYHEMVALVGDEDRLRNGEQRWRHEYPVTDRLMLIATNPRQGHFLRVRWDGSLLSKRDFRTVGLEQGMFGSYRPGRVEELLEEFSARTAAANVMEAA
jgi:hypothetical protein